MRVNRFQPQQISLQLRSSRCPAYFSRQQTAFRHHRASNLIVRAENSSKDEKNRKLVGDIERSLKQSGLDQIAAKKLMEDWSLQVGHQITKDDLRKILVGQSSKALALVFISTLLDIGAAVGAFTVGNVVDQLSDKYGLVAYIGEALAYLVAGYYATGVFFDFFKLGAVIIAQFNFRVNSGALLEALEDIASQSNGAGLESLDKVREAVNSVKVLNALNKMSDIIKQQNVAAGTKDSADVLADLGAYLTLDRAQKKFNFDASEFGLSDEEAAEIAVIFGKYDVNGDGVLSEEEFSNLVARYCPDELGSREEVKAALAIIDTNKDGTIDFLEFVRFWQNKIKVKSAF